MSIRTFLIGGVAAAALAGPAMAQTMATTSVDLNLRAGPGPAFEVVGVIPAETSVDVTGCQDGDLWCEVTYDGTSGWASGGYLNAEEDNAPLRTMDGMETTQTAVTVGTVTYEPETSDDEAALGVGTQGAIAGFAFGGPVGALAGAAAGLVGGALTNPEGEVVTYVTANPVEPVYVPGEVAIGATVPEEVTLYDTPSDEVRYIYVNGQPVLVEPETRQVIYISR
ncbi:SH3 domain-containing protein [Wenxinia saemankumensis]|uniref:Uncharacterized conserved protein YraI n=1 Tax=Wenxinia saemankumensis TaxID=1447782 RepID=A0A1M6GPS3_9RHOB|nr:SH3 domain-containing protein [Wenxinia saemankumensis]SHJ11918.1 Uncharacterized conserved protein YraI [Wenxinia saemankumensis]